MSPRKNAEIAVLMTCHNRLKKTLVCLDSLWKNDISGLELTFTVFLVDDGSTDGTRDLVASSFPDVHIISGSGSLYWNQGMRLAWKSALSQSVKFDYFLLLNDDVILYPETLRNLYLNAIDSSIVCGSVWDGQKVTYGGYYADDKLITNLNSKQSCNYCNGNILLVSAGCVEKIGILSNSFRHGLGDFDYSFRASKKGINLILMEGVHGICEANKREKRWYNTNMNTFDRLKELYSPLGGCVPHEYFIFAYNRFGFRHALLMYCWLHFSAVFPSLSNLVRLK